MYLDIFAGSGVELDDLHKVAAQPQLDQDLRGFQRALVAGDRVTETGPVVIADFDVVKLRLHDEPPTVTLLICVDRSQAAGLHAGEPWRGSRYAMRYRVTQTGYLPEPGWAVTKVLPPPGHDGPTSC